MNTYANWKAPASDTDLLIWPTPAEMLRQYADNQKSLDNQTTLVQHALMSDLRRSVRKFLDHDNAQPLIATGHQVELYHPGVWVKNILIDEIAKKVDGKALHVAVDTDSPKHLNLRWPGGGISLTDDEAVNHVDWSGAVAPPSPGHLVSVEQTLAKQSDAWDFTTLAKPFFDALRPHAMSQQMLPAALLQACHEIDWSLGLRHHALLLSPILECDGYLAFVHHIACQIERFAADYNQSLADYRKENNVHTASRPMPDLRVLPDQIELPFWIDDLTTGHRTRASLVRKEGRWTLPPIRSGGDEFVFDPTSDAFDASARLRRYLRASGLRISTRALTLTMFFRLFMVDLFVHGIGGGRYDQVTDQIINRFFKVSAPPFAVTTATLFFPGAGVRSDVCIPCLMSEGHRLRHNLPGVAKQPYLQTIQSSPRKSVARRQAFKEMHRQLQENALQTTELTDWGQRLASASKQLASDKITFDRELFYTLQTRARLESMVERYRNELK